jgi:Raf kinase inhibitor-like YbhB/YbcL family protein
MPGVTLHAMTWRVIGTALLTMACSGHSASSAEPKASPQAKGKIGSLDVSSTSFQSGGAIPSGLTCEGNDTSPALAWSGAPSGTKSFAIIEDDPDAPNGDWVHWVLYDIPAGTTSLTEGAGVPDGSKPGSNGWNAGGYRGPCPPSGTHHYHHKVYALDVVLPDLGTPSKQKLEKAMDGHVLAKGELIGTYHKKG